MENPLPRRVAANPTQYNIDAIAKLEHDALDRRTLTERVATSLQNLWAMWDSCWLNCFDLRLGPGKSPRDPRT